MLDKSGAEALEERGESEGLVGLVAFFLAVVQYRVEKCTHLQGEDKN